MKAKEAIAQAKALLADFYADEVIAGIRLEEVEFDEPNDSWLITLGILRPPIEPASTIVAQAMPNNLQLTRTYKILRIPNNVADEPSMKIRELLTED